MFKTKKYLSIVLIFVLIFSNISYAGSYISEDEIYIDKPYKIFNFEMTDKIDRNTVDNTTATINGIDIRIAYKDDYTLSIIPLEKYSEGTTYEIKLMGNIQSMAGESLVPFSQKFIYIDYEDSNQPTNFENIIFEETNTNEEEPSENEEEKPIDGSEDESSDEAIDENDPEDTGDDTIDEEPEDTEESQEDEEGSDSEEEYESEEEQTVTHIVLFKDYTGGLLSQQEVEESSSATEPTQPERDGYTFVGWDTEFNNITEDTIVTAQYEENEVTYKVTFVDYDDDILFEDTVVEGQDATPPTESELTRESYVFSGWSGDYTNILENKIVRAEYKEIFKVNFLDMNGDVFEEEEALEGESISTPILPEVEGYDFIEWDTDTSNIQKDLTVNPIYEKKMFTVTLKERNPERGNIKDLDEVKVKYGENVDLTAYEEYIENMIIEGMTFRGWSEEGTDITEDKTIYADFVASDFMVTYLVEKDGLPYYNERVIRGESGTIDPPDKYGKVFVRWSEDISNVTESMTVYPIYEVAKYTVKYIDYDGDEISTETVEHGIMPTPPTPEREGYTFTGWDIPTDEPITKDMVFITIYEEDVVEDTTTPGAIDIDEDTTTSGAITLNTLKTYEDLTQYEKIAKTILDGNVNFETEINLGVSIPITEYKSNVEPLLNNRKNIPNVSYSIDITDGYMDSITKVTYKETDEATYNNVVSQLDTLIDNFAFTDESNREKSEIIGDYLMEKFSYDSSFTHANKLTGQTFYAITRDTTVCSGYAHTYKYLLEKVGIRSDIVNLDYVTNTGTYEPHSYNKVHLSPDEIVYTDLTHADTDIVENWRYKYINHTSNVFDEPDKRVNLDILESMTLQ